MNDQRVDEALLEATARALDAAGLGDATADGARIEGGGEDYEVVLLPGVAAVRIARRADRTRELERVARLTAALAACDLPFTVPTPLGPVIEHEGRAALATRWIAGSEAPRGSRRPTQVAALLDALASVDTAPLVDLLAPPHAYAGGADWYRLHVEEVLPRLAARHRQEALDRLDAAHALPPVTTGLVHGDLAGDNVRWVDGEVVGVLDWDLASAWDPAVDAACCAWHGWDMVAEVTDEPTYERAVTWYRTFGLEQVGAALAAGASDEQVKEVVARATGWLDTFEQPAPWRPTTR